MLKACCNQHDLELSSCYCHPGLDAIAREKTVDTFQFPISSTTTEEGKKR